MSWLLLALTQLAILTVLLLVSTALLRRAYKPSRPRRMSGTKPALDVPAVPDHGPSDDLLQQALKQADAATAELKAGWIRVRSALHQVLESAQPILEHSSWGELQRLLCAADQLIGTPSPAIEFRDDTESNQSGRWGTLMSGLAQLRTAASSSEADAGDDTPGTTLNEDTTHAILGALILAVDELRTAKPEAARHESSREMELRQMILQFTHDSRDMLTCIRRLESENATLRTQIPANAADAA